MSLFLVSKAILLAALTLGFTVVSKQFYESCHSIVLWIVQNALHLTPADLFIPTPSRLSGRHSTTLQLQREDYSFTHLPLSVARYSFIQLSELWQRGMNEITKASKRQPEDSNPGSLRIRCSTRYATAPRCVLLLRRPFSLFVSRGLSAFENGTLSETKI